MKQLRYLLLTAFALLFCFCANAQFSTVKYVSHGYFDGLQLDSSKVIKESTVITIEGNQVNMVRLDLSNPENDSLFYTGKSLSALKYPAGDGSGEYYYVWKLGDRKMVLRLIDGTKYLSVYKTDDFGLPEEYLTYKIDN